MIKQDLRSLVRMILLLAKTDMQIGMHVTLVPMETLHTGGDDKAKIACTLSTIFD